MYNWSDAWLLLAIIHASKKGDATLEKIIAAGDAIDHAVFESDELESGLARLTSGGYIKEKNSVFSATPKVMRAYEKATSARHPIRKELKDIEELIGAASATNDQPNENNLKYPGFSVDAYNDLVDKYTENF